MDRLLNQTEPGSNYAGEYLPHVEGNRVPEAYLTKAQSHRLAECGALFTNLLECTNNVRALAVAAGFQLQVKQSGSHKTWTCRGEEGEPCTFKVVAIVNESGVLYC